MTASITASLIWRTDALVVSAGNEALRRGPTGDFCIAMRSERPRETSDGHVRCGSTLGQSSTGGDQSRHRSASAICRGALPASSIRRNLAILHTLLSQMPLYSLYCDLDSVDFSFPAHFAIQHWQCLRVFSVNN